MSTARASRTTPSDYLLSHGPEAALWRSRAYSPELRTVWDLFLATRMRSNTEMASVLNGIQDRRAGKLFGGLQELAAVLLAEIAVLDESQALQIASRVLDEDGLLSLCSHLLCRKAFDTAAKLCLRINSLIHQHRALMAVTYAMLDVGEQDAAARWWRTIADGLCDDADSWLPYLLFDVTVAIASAWAAIGEFRRAEATLTDFRVSSGARSIESLSAYPRIRTLLPYAEYKNCRGERSSACDIITQCEALAGTCADPIMQGWCWVDIAVTCRRVDDSTRAVDAINRAIECKTSLPVLSSANDESPIHEDAFHGPCLQGLQLAIIRELAKHDLVSEAFSQVTQPVASGRRDVADGLIVVSCAATRLRQDAVLQKCLGQLREIIADMPVIEGERVRARAHWAGVPGSAAPDIESVLQLITNDEQRVGQVARETLFFLEGPASGGPLSSRELVVDLDVRIHDDPESMSSQSDGSADATAFPREELDRIVDDLNKDRRQNDYIGTVLRLKEMAMTEARRGSTNNVLKVEAIAQRAYAKALNEHDNLMLFMGLDNAAELSTRNEMEAVNDRVRRLCAYGAAAASAGHRRPAEDFHRLAMNSIRAYNSPRWRTAVATDIAISGAQWLGVILQPAVKEISLGRPDALVDVLASLRIAPTGVVDTTEIGRDILALVLEVSQTLSAAIRCCGVFGQWRPDHAASIAVALRGSWSHLSNLMI